MAKKKEEYYAINKKSLVTAILIIVVMAVVFGFYYKEDIQKFLGRGEAAEQKGPLPKFELIVVENPECSECMNSSQAAEVIKGAPTINITSDRIVAFDSEEGKKLIEKYGIGRLPAFILKGKKLDVKLDPFEKNRDALVFANVPPVYYDIKKDKVVGKVTVIIITKPDCTKCFNISKVVDQLELYGVAVIGRQEVGYNSKEGAALLKEYGIIKVPTLMLSEDAIEYEAINQSWKQLGSIEKDGKLVLRTVNAPYYDLLAKKTKGLVDITYLVDEKCTACYSPLQFKSYFQQSLGVVFDKTETVDISSSEGKEMLKKYNITLVPTAVFSSDLSEYPAVKQLWSQMGKVVDGDYVFTKVDKLQGIKYKDLSTGEMLGEEPKEIQVKVGNQTE